MGKSESMNGEKLMRDFEIEEFHSEQDIPSFEEETIPAVEETITTEEVISIEEIISTEEVTLTEEETIPTEEEMTPTEEEIISTEEEVIPTEEETIPTEEQIETPTPSNWWNNILKEWEDAKNLGGAMCFTAGEPLCPMWLPAKLMWEQQINKLLKELEKEQPMLADMLEEPVAYVEYVTLEPYMYLMSQLAQWESNNGILQAGGSWVEKANATLMPMWTMWTSQWEKNQAMLMEQWETNKDMWQAEGAWLEKANATLMPMWTMLMTQMELNQTIFEVDNAWLEKANATLTPMWTMLTTQWEKNQAMLEVDSAWIQEANTTLMPMWTMWMSQWEKNQAMLMEQWET